MSKKSKTPQEQKSQELSTLRQSSGESASASSYLSMLSGMMPNYSSKEWTDIAVKAGIACCVVTTVLTVTLCVVLIDDKLDSNCDRYKIKNKAGSTLYFDFGNVWDGYSFYVDVPEKNHSTEVYPFTFYDKYYVENNCDLKVRPKGAKNGEPPVEITGCNRPNAYDAFGCEYEVKDKTGDRRHLRGSWTSLENDLDQVKEEVSIFSLFASTQAATTQAYSYDMSATAEEAYHLKS